MAPPEDLTRPDLRGSFGMCASTHWLATGTAQAVLERGGNAFDAAVAAAFVLHLVEPHLNGPGGDLTAVVAVAGRSRPRVLCGQGPAPAGATIEHFRSLGLTQVPGSGALAAAVPGAVDALLLMLHDLGRWELADVLDIAIGYAEHGYPLVPAVHQAVSRVRELFTEHWPTSAEFWAPERGSDGTGRRTNPAYAAVLRRLVAAGSRETTREARIGAARRDWATGVAARAAAYAAGRPHRHGDGGVYAGVLQFSDFSARPGPHRRGVGWEEAVLGRFRGYTVAKAGPWSQGPALLSALAILDGFPDADLDPQSVQGAHHAVEALKLALADRDAWFGDPSGDPAGGPGELAVPLARLLSPAYAAERRALVGRRASAQFRPGSVPGRVAFRPATSKPRGPGLDPAAGEPTLGPPHGDTCHLDVVDRFGNLVALTPSGGWLQSSPHIPELGFCLGTRLQMTWLDPAAPSALRPGHRPRSTLSPTLVLRDGQPMMALGTPGGDQQEQWQLVFLLRVLAGGYTPQQAIDAPTLHTTARVDSFWPREFDPLGVVAEDRVGPDVLAGLAERGHRVGRAGPWALGRVSAVWRDPESKDLGAAANARGQQGYAAGR